LECHCSSGQIVCCGGGGSADQREKCTDDWGGCLREKAGGGYSGKECRAGEGKSLRAWRRRRVGDVSALQTCRLEEGVVFSQKGGFLKKIWPKGGGQFRTKQFKACLSSWKVKTQPAEKKRGSKELPIGKGILATK